MSANTPTSNTHAIAGLNFSLELKDGSPQIVTTAVDGDGEPMGTVGIYPTEVQHIFVPLEAASLRSIIALDVLEHVLDEPEFLHECARLLRVGGRLELRVPAEGLSGWLDSLNIYRYVTDISGRGHDPEESKPTGWHRHYRNDDLVRIVCDAGFDVVSVRRTNPGLSELPHATALMIGDFGLGKDDTEARLFAWRRKISAFENRIPAGALGTRFTLVAHRL